MSSGRWHIVLAAATLAFAGLTMAATPTFRCPDAGKIKSVVEDDCATRADSRGVIYSADDGGIDWEGEDPSTCENKLHFKMTFAAANILASGQVTCDYKPTTEQAAAEADGKPKIFLRLSSKGDTRYEPVAEGSDGWSAQESNGTSAQRCTGGSSPACLFREAR